jgi:hypothetical protein
MKDLVKDQVNHYLYQFYYLKSTEILISELRKLIIKQSAEYKLDILFIEKTLTERGLSNDIDSVYKDVANNKVVYK